MNEEALQRIERSLGRIEGSLGSVADRLQQHVEKDERAFSAAFKRIDSLETTRDKQKGAAKLAAIALAFISAAASIFAKAKGIF